MNTTAEIFEIEPFQHELEAEARPARGGVRSAPRRPVSKPWPSFRKRRILRTPSIYGGWGGKPDAGAEPKAEPDPPPAAGSPEYVRWLQSTLNRAIGGSLPIDGVMSAAVRDAIREFQRNNRLPASGYIGSDTESALRRVSAGSEREQLEFEWEAGLRGDALAVDGALSAKQSAAHPIYSQVTRAAAGSGPRSLCHSRWPVLYWRGGRPPPTHHPALVVPLPLRHRDQEPPARTMPHARQDQRADSRHRGRDQ